MSKLRQVLQVFEEAEGPLSLSQVAYDLDLPPDRLEAMIDHWMRRGKIRSGSALSNCGTCGDQDGCPFVVDLPRSYELVTDQSIPLDTYRIGVPCSAETNHTAT